MKIIKGISLVETSSARRPFTELPPLPKSVAVCRSNDVYRRVRQRSLRADLITFHTQKPHFYKIAGDRWGVCGMAINNSRIPSKEQYMKLWDIVRTKLVWLGIINNPTSFEKAMGTQTEL